MSTKEDIKNQIKDRYETVKELYKTKPVTLSNLKESSVDAKYLSTMAKIDEEYSNYQKNVGNYIVKIDSIKTQQLIKRLNVIKNDFFKIVPYDQVIALIEMELEQNASLIEKYNNWLKEGPQNTGNIENTKDQCVIL